MNGHRKNGNGTSTLERPAARKTGLAKLCILATETTHVGDRNGQPRPMVEVGGRPLLWHMLMHFNAHGVREFVVALGPGGDRVKRYLLDYANLSSDLTLSLDREKVQHAGGPRPDWSVDLIDVTSAEGRGRLRDSLAGGTVLVGSGDSLTDADPADLLSFHARQARPATLVAVRPQARFGTLDIVEGRVMRFAEKPQQEEGWVSSGLLVLDGSLLDNDALLGDPEALAALAGRGEVSMYRHEGFWHRIETLRDKQVLDEQWLTGKADWRTWDSRQ
jgi:glucose-1-phosphate cytidylyltransferase